MVKNSHILPVFGLGLILSTSPLFTLLDSSPITQIENISEETTIEAPTKVDSPSEDVAESQPKEDSSPEDHSSLPKETETISPETTPTTPTTATPSTQTEPFEVASKVPEVSPKPQEISSPIQTNISPSLNSKSSGTSSSSGTGKKSIRPKKPYSKDYSSNKKTKTQGLHEVTFNDGKKRYLYSYDEDIKFSLPDSQQQYQKVQKENISISILKHSAWKNDSKSVDEYESIKGEQIDELFKDRENDPDKKKRLRQILLSLSNRREWKFHVDSSNYSSQLEKPTLVSVDGDRTKTGLELKIKYFDNFEDLRDYVKEKMDLCAEEKGPCLVKEEEIAIIDQDRKSFFANVTEEVSE